MGNKNNSNDQEEITSLPDVAMIIIKEQGKSSSSIRLLNLDNYGDDIRKKYYMDAISKYGRDNVRYCKIVQSKVKVEVEFVDQ